MKAKSLPISFTRIISGISDYDKESILPDSVAFARQIDFRTNPRRWTLLPKTRKESGSVVTDLPLWGDRILTDTYLYGDTGNIYKRTSGGTVTLERSVSGSHGNGMKFFSEDQFLYYTTDKAIGRYGRIGSTPVYVDDFLGAQGGIPTNTASLNLEAASEQYATAADSASLSQTGDITLEINAKPESLPDAGSEMVLISKWNENSDERSYKMTVYGISGYFGNGADGALTISSNTTEAPIDSACSGTSGAYSLTATNASFAADQVVLIHQSRGTGAGTWQRNTISGYTAGTITLQNTLNFSYASGAQVRVLKQYTNVTVNSGITYTTKAWNGTVGGILAFLANGTATVNGTISANGGNGSTSTTDGVGGGTGGGFRGGGIKYGTAPPTAYCGEGTSGASAQQSGANGNGGGGAPGTGDGPGSGGGNGTAGGGNNGGSTSGTADLTTMTFGGGGGGSYNDGGSCGGGGSGGGIIFMTAATLTVHATTGLVSANGGLGANGESTSDGGSGAGGSVLLKAQTATLETTRVTATAGSATGSGGAGGTGRIHLDYYTSYTGTTSPTLDVTQDYNLVTNTVYHLRLYVSSTGLNEEIYTKEMSSYTTGVWKHLAIGWDASASTAYFYEDGVSLGQATGALTAIYNGTALLGIGADFSAAGAARSFFDGKVDNGRLWSVLRSATEINNNKEVETATEVNLQAGYQVDNSVSDSTANANDLTLVNAPTYSTDIPFSAPTTRQDIDQEDTSTGDTYALATSISEAAAHRQTFVPAKDPQKSIAVYIADTGDDGDWTVTVHDDQNREIASKTLANADLALGHTEFIFEETEVAIADSYTEDNQDTYVGLGSDTYTGVGQSFILTSAVTLDSCKFYLRKVGSPTGNAVAKIYAHSGVFGTSSVPTGAALATSDNFDSSTLTTTFQPITFDFSGANRITLSASTHYVLTIEYSGGDASNAVVVGTDNSDPSHSGNASRYFTSWLTMTRDTIFYLYGETTENVVWTPVIGATYHFHVTASSITGVPTLVAGTNNNLETGEFKSYYQFLIEDNFHPTDQMLNIMCFGNGRYLATYDASTLTYNPHRLTFPSGWNVRCLSKWREYFAIGCWKGTSISDYDQGMIFFWDGISDTYNSFVEVPEGAVNAMLGSQGTLYIVAGYQGDLLEYTGGKKALKVKRIPKITDDTYVEVLPGSMSMWRTLLQIGVGVTDSSEIEQGVYSWGKRNQSYIDGLSYDYKISTGNTTASNIKIGLLLPVNKKLLIGWKDNISYGLDSVDPTNDCYGEGSIEWLIRDEDALWKEKKPDVIRADFEPLVDGDTVGIQFKLDRSGDWSVEETETTADAKKLRVQPSVESLGDEIRHREYQVRLNLKTTNTSSPAGLGLTVLEDALTDEEFV